MTQEEKNILLKDLSARLSYGTRIHISHPSDNAELDDWLTTGTIDNFSFFGSVKPYLRPMFSMTEEEQEEFRTLILPEASCAYEDCLEWDIQIIGSGYLQIFVDDFSKVVDWLNEHHFDYRGLIEKGLALEAPEEMYKIE